MALHLPFRWASAALLLLAVSFSNTMAQNVGVDVPTPLQKLDVAGGLRIGNTTNGLAGSLRWNGTRFEGYDGSSWVDLGRGSNWTVSGTHIFSSNTGNVGIGTVAPASKLHLAEGELRVSHSAAAPTVRFVDGADNSFMTINYQRSLDRLELRAQNNEPYFMMRNTNGYIGLGVLATENPTERLHVVGSIRMVDGNQAAGRVMVSNASGVATWTDASSLNITETDPQVGSSTTNQIPKWNGTALVDGQVFDNGTNIGIGTTNPTDKLDIHGNVDISNVQPVLRFSATGTPRTSNVTATFSPTTTTGQTLRFNLSNNTSTGTSEVMRLQGDGKVGIGISDPGAYLDVYGVGDNGSSTSLRLRSGNAGLGSLSNQIVLGNGGISTIQHAIKTRHHSSLHERNAIDFYVWQPGDGTDVGTKRVLTIDGRENGMVGIGVLEPRDELHVVGNIRMVDGNEAAGRVLVSDVNGTASWTAASALSITETDPQVSSSTTNMLPKWNGTALVDGQVFDNGTNIGIGTASPTSKLHLSNGALRISHGSASPTILFTDEADNSFMTINYQRSFDRLELRTQDNSPHFMMRNTNGYVGLGVDELSNPSERLHVVGNIRMVDGNQAAGRVMVSNGSGVATWTDATSLTVTETDPQVSSATTNILPKWNGTTLVDGTIFDNGNIGIGNTSPQEKLHVTGKLRMADGTQGAGKVLVSDANGSASWADATSLTVTETDPQVSSSTTNMLPKWNGTTLVDGQVFDNGTNIGIGTTSPGAKLDIAGTLNGSGGATFGNNVAVTGDYHFTNTNGTGTNNPSFRVDGNADKFYVIAESNATGPATGTEIRLRTATSNVTAVDRMTINNTGNVGIGTTNPSEIMHVVRNTSDAIIKVESPGGLYDARIMFQKNGANTATVGFFPGTAELRLRTGQATGILFEPNGVERMRVHSDGNVGIGNTLPQEKLHVTGKLRMSDGTQGAGKVLVSDANGSAAWADATTLTVTETDPQVSSSATNMLPKWNGTTLVDGTIFDNGSVGIGTSSPGAPLHVSANSATAQLLVNPSATSGQDGAITIRGARNGSTTSNQAQLRFENYDLDLSTSNTLGTIVGRVTNAVTNVGDLVFNTSMDGTVLSETARMTSGGNVGIGAATPQEKLHIAGKIRMADGTQGAGKMLISDANGSASWSQGTQNVAYVKNTGTFSHDNTDGYEAITGTASLDVYVGDIITVQANASVRLTGGAGVDDFFFLASYAGCSTGNLNETNYFPSEDGNDHDNYIPISYLDVFVAPCTGTLTFQFNARNVGDDPWTAEDRVLVVRRN